MTVFWSGSSPLPNRMRNATRPPVATSRSVTRRRTQRSEEHTSELQSQFHLVCRLLLEKKNRAQRPRVPWESTIVYEAHVRGYTMRHPAVPGELRGKFAGLAVREIVNYIRSLGVTSIELLPGQASIVARTLIDKNLTNYWRYDTIGFCAPEPRFFFLMIRPPPRSTLFPYTTLFR